MVTTTRPDGSTDVESVAPEAWSPPPQSFHMTLEMTPEAYETLHQLAGDAGQSLDEVIRSALGMYKSAVDAHRAGKAVGIAEAPDRLDTSFF